MDYDSYLSSSNPVKLFVGQIPKEINEPILSNYFEEFGAIKEISIMRDVNGMSKGKLQSPEECHGEMLVWNL